MSMTQLTRAAVLLFAALLLPASVRAQALEKRVGLVIGNGAYQAGPLATPANDAGLIAQTLQAAGFDVVGARDLDATTLRSSFKEFLEKVGASGPDTVALVYFAGHAVQFEGENYIVPVDARLARDTDVPIEAFRLSDLTKPLAALPLKARIVILDAARANDFAKGPQPLAGGLALVQPDNGMLIAFNAAPGTIGPESKTAYGAYATALSEMIKDGGLSLSDVFERVRLRVNESTAGSELPWNASRVDAPFLFFERTNAAPQAQSETLSDLRGKPIAEMDAHDAYLAALARDSFGGYQDFLTAYPTDPLAKRVRAILAARREAATWRESAMRDTPDAYWSYLRRYPRGPHAREGQRRLTHFAAAIEPPADFAEIEYDVPPPPPEEIVYVERPVLYYGDPVFDLPPPPPVPIIFLPPQPAYYVDYPPPPPPMDVFVLPIPIYYPVPIWVERPAYVAPPPVNIVNVNIHNSVVVNERDQTATVTNPAGQQVPPLPASLLRTQESGSQPGRAPDNGQPGFVGQHSVVSAAIAAAAVALPTQALRNRAPRPTAIQQGQVPTLKPLPGKALAPSVNPPPGQPQVTPLKGAQPLPLPSNQPRPGGKAQSETPLIAPQTGPATPKLRKQNLPLGQPSDQGAAQTSPAQNARQRIDAQRQQLLIQRQQAKQQRQLQQQNEAGQQRTEEAAALRAQRQQAQQAASQRALQQQQLIRRQESAQQRQQQQLIQRQDAVQQRQQQNIQRQQAVQERLQQQQYRQQRIEQPRPAQQGRRRDCGGPDQAPCH